MFKRLLVLPLIILLSLTACAKKSLDPLAEVYSDSNQCHVKDASGEMSTLFFWVMEHKAKDKDKLTDLSDSKVKEKIHQTLKRGGNVNEPNHGMYPLVFAVAMMDDEVNKILMDNGANPALKMTTTSKVSNGKDTFEYSKALLEKNSSPERVRIDKFIQSYKK